VAVLNVESSRLAKWYDQNLLLIGDAAHVMSPVGGVGINYAIQAAIVMAGIVGPALLQNSLTESHLASACPESASDLRWAVETGVSWFEDCASLDAATPSGRQEHGFSGDLPCSAQTVATAEL